MQRLWLAPLFGLYACAAPTEPVSETSDDALTFAPAAWTAKHNLTSAQYQAEVTRLAELGYQPKSVSAYESDGAARYAALFEKPLIAIPWVARHNLTGAQFQQEFTTWSGQGYRLTEVNGAFLDGTARYTAIFEKKSSNPWGARHGMTSAQYQAEVTAQWANGYRPVHVSGYSSGGTAYFAAIFEKKTGAWVARHDMSSAGYQTEYNTWTAQGYRLAQVSGYAINGSQRYAAIWEAGSGAGYVARHAMTTANYQAEFDNQYYAGYRLKSVSGFAVGDSPRFAAIWTGGGMSGTDMATIDSIVSSYMDEYDVPGLGLAISKDGRLVFARGFGKADVENDVRTSPNNLFRIASVSKPITSVGILTLVEQGKINLDQKVFGTGGVLGNDYGTPPYGADIRAITVRHLLTHTAGGWSNSSNDPMFAHESYSQKELIDWVLDERPLDNYPGTNYAYSNFGYCVLGRIIEKKTGVDYDTWIKQNVLSKAGISKMQIGGDTLAERKSGEVVYYGSPYGMEVTRMDSHGGWIASPIDLVRFMTRVDGFDTRPDILTPASITQFTTGTSANPSYGLGIVKNGNNWWHNGSLPGTHSYMVRTGGGYVWSILVNTKSSKAGFSGGLDQVMWDIVGGVENFPSYDLF